MSGGAIVSLLSRGLMPGRLMSRRANVLHSENRGRGLGPHLTQCGEMRGLYLHAKFDLDPSNRLVTIHQRHGQTDWADRTTV